MNTFTGIVINLYDTHLDQCHSNQDIYGRDISSETKGRRFFKHLNLFAIFSAVVSLSYNQNDSSVLVDFGHHAIELHINSIINNQWDLKSVLAINSLRITFNALRIYNLYQSTILQDTFDLSLVEDILNHSDLVFHCNNIGCEVMQIVSALRR